MNIPRAREALEDLLKSPNMPTSARYYAKLALSHLQETTEANQMIIEQMKRDHGKG